MKKMFKTLCAIIIFSLALQFIINLLIKKHKINYTLISDNNNYNIIEKYNKYGYYFSITDKYKHKKPYWFYYSVMMSSVLFHVVHRFLQ